MPLTIKPPKRPSIATGATVDTPVRDAESVSAVEHDGSNGEPISPLAPPLSPLSPVVKTATLADSYPEIAPVDVQPSNHEVMSANPRAHAEPATQYIDKPPSRPFSGEDATDAIALRAAISSLQFQKKKAEEDIRTLRGIKEQAIARPDDFQRHVIDSASRQGGKPTREQMPEFTAPTMNIRADGNGDMDNQDYMNHEVPDSQPSAGNLGSFDTAPMSSQPMPPTQSASFGTVPQPQDVVRCPPINWDKYHIVGEPLDRMHRDQQLRPYEGVQPGKVARERLISAPYDPMYDHISPVAENVQNYEQRKDSHASIGDQGVGRRRSSKISNWHG